ncbi:MAG: RNA-directed DNA polymerase [Bacteroidetes bacterium]|nr:RNA-directed DNA polymerase [Bacteroidota bacterium]
MPIGNLTSQIFANIYLNELDRFVKHELKVKYYLRYGDDFILVHPDREKLIELRELTVRFLEDVLMLKMNPKNDKILKVSHGLKFLGVVICSDGKTLNKRNIKRIKNRINLKNVGSYHGLVNKHSLSEFSHEFDWWIYDLIESEF